MKLSAIKNNLEHMTYPNFNITRARIPNAVSEDLITMSKLLYDDPNSIPWDANLAGVMRPPAKQLLIHNDAPLFQGFKKILLETAAAYIDNYLHCLQQLSAAPKLGDLHYKIECTTAWTVHQYQNDYNPLHAHMIPTHESALSGFLHLTLPTGCRTTDGTPDGCTLFSWGCSPKNFLNELKFSPIEMVIPEENIFYVFPIWLNHLVYPFRGTGERLSIAWNLGIDWGEGEDLVFPPKTFKEIDGREWTKERHVDNFDIHDWWQNSGNTGQMSKPKTSPAEEAESR